MKLYCASFPRLLEPLPIPQAFARHTELVMQLDQMPVEHVPTRLESRLVKEQFLDQLESLDELPDPELFRSLTRQAFCAGLLCGALDGTRLYRLDDGPEAFDCPAAFESLPEDLARIHEVAEQYWRGLDPDQLHEQSRYGRENNMDSEQENLIALGRPGVNAASARHLLLETFRTAYGSGVVDAALACLTHEAPDGLPSEFV